jgi:DNA-binding YbaB/EbfC family protein
LEGVLGPGEACRAQGRAQLVAEENPEAKRRKNGSMKPFSFLEKTWLRSKKISSQKLSRTEEDVTMNNMDEMMKQVKKMQEQMLKMQEDLGNKTVEGTAGGGVVSVTVNGHKKVTAVVIKPEMVDTDGVEMLQDLILTAINDAMTKAEEMADKELSKWTGGMNIPGLF